MTPDSTVDVLSLINIKGDSNLQENIRTLCTEFKNIFSYELPAEPAKIEPFNLVVETEKWRVPSNRLPPRPRSALKQIGRASCRERVSSLTQLVLMLTGVEVEAY